MAFAHEENGAFGGLVLRFFIDLASSSNGEEAMTRHEGRCS